jgi:hypothetical protein
MRILRWARKHLVLLVLAATVLVPVTLGLHWWYWPSVPTLVADEVQSIEVHLLPFPKGYDADNCQDEARVTITAPAQIGALLDVFRTAERASEHKCPNSGTITIRTKSGDTEELGILPGHNSAYYEYRYGNRINRVDRGRFVAALKAIGVSRVKLSPP